VNPNKADVPSGFAPVIAEYFHVHVKSIARWDRKPGLQFPKAVRINGRKYRRWDEIYEFERRAAAAHASQRTPKPHHSEEETRKRPPI
jgi:hypothetical protein